MDILGERARERESIQLSVLLSVSFRECVFQWVVENINREVAWVSPVECRAPHDYFTFNSIQIHHERVRSRTGLLKKFSIDIAASFEYAGQYSHTNVK